MLPYDPTTLAAFAAANPCASTASIPISQTMAIDSSYYNTSTNINSEYLEISGRRFSTKQLAYLLSKLLEEHPECQV